MGHSCGPFGEGFVAKVFLHWHWRPCGCRSTSCTELRCYGASGDEITSIGRLLTE